MAALMATPGIIQDLLGDVEVIARYGTGTGGPLPAGGHGTPISLNCSDLPSFLAESIAREILLPADSDFHLQLPDGRLKILFCHEGHIHVGGNDTDLVMRFVGFKPFRDLLHRPQPPNQATRF